MRIRIYLLVFLGGLIGPFWLFAISCSKAAHMEDLRVPETVPPAACVVVGFLGGHDARDDATKGVRQLALRLREPGHIYTETFSNQSRKLAEAYLFAILDRNGDGTIGIDERRTLVVYGQSYGGAAVVKFAWRLAHLQVPIHLTVQIDSVGTDDARIPPNVTFAANLYQKNGWIIAGENPIRPVDPSRTGILGNWLFDYDSPPGSEINIDDLSFWKKLMRVAHAKMDRDPRVWKLTEGVIREACRMGRLETRGFGLTEP